MRSHSDEEENQAKQARQKGDAPRHGKDKDDRQESAMNRMAWRTEHGGSSICIACIARDSPFGLTLLVATVQTRRRIDVFRVSCESLVGPISHQICDTRPCHKMIACAVLPCTTGGGLGASATNERSGMRTRVIGAMPIGSSAVTEPDARGHEAVQESRIWDASAVGYGASDAEATSVVFDVTDSLSFSETPGAVEFFEISTAYFGDVEHSFRLISSSRFD